MIHHSIFGLPASRRFYAPDGGAPSGSPGGGTATLDAPSGSEGGGGGGLDTIDTSPIAPVKSIERVEGEQPPDFSSLGKSRVKEAPKPEEAAPASDVPKKEEKPAGEAANARKEAKKDELKPPETVKKEEPAKKDAPKPEAKKEEPKKKEAPKLPDEKTLDAIKPFKGTSPEQEKSFKDIKEIARTAIRAHNEAQAEAERIKAEAEELRKQLGKPTPELEAELNDHREFRRLVEAENHPAFVQEYAGKVSAIEGDIYSFLEAHKLKPEVLAEIKKHAEAAGGDIEAWPRWGDVLKRMEAVNPIDKEHLASLLYQRRATLTEKKNKIGQIAKDKEKFFGTLREKEDKDKLQWAKVIQDKSIELAAPHDWLQPREVPADANEEQRKAIEAHNQAADGAAKQFQENVRNTWFRDGPKTAEVAFKAIVADHLEAELTTVTTEKDKLAARVRELEDRLAKIKGASRTTSEETPAADLTESRTPETTVEPGKIGGDGSTALRGFFARKQRQ